MTITRDIIIDLLPLYASGEASADTQRAVSEHLKTDPSLAALLRALQGEAPPAAAVPAGLETEAINRTRRVIRQRSWLFGLALFLTLLPLSFGFLEDPRRGTFFMLRDVPYSALVWVGAAALWVRYARLSRQLKGKGLIDN
jgi:anti-sigma factor RsiW